MDVDHRRADVLVAEQFLHRTDVVTGFEEVRGEGMAKGMAGDGFGDAGTQRGLAHSFLQRTFVVMMAASLAAPWIGGEFCGRKEILLGPFPGCMRVFFRQSVGQVDFAIVFGEIGFMEQLDVGQVGLQGAHQAGR